MVAELATTEGWTKQNEVASISKFGKENARKNALPGIEWVNERMNSRADY